MTQFPLLVLCLSALFCLFVADQTIKLLKLFLQPRKRKNRCCVSCFYYRRVYLSPVQLEYNHRSRQYFKYEQEPLLGVFIFPLTTYIWTLVPLKPFFVLVALMVGKVELSSTLFRSFRSCVADRPRQCYKCSHITQTCYRS